MWPFKFIDEEKDLQIADLMDERDSLRRQLEKKSNDSFRETMADVTKSSFSFDWKNGRAFSIERIQDWMSHEEIYVPVTIIGYHAPDSIPEDPDKVKVGEWKFYCSQQEHDRLVEEFNKYRDWQLAVS